MNIFGQLTDWIKIRAWHAAFIAIALIANIWLYPVWDLSDWKYPDMARAFVSLLISVLIGVALGGFMVWLTETLPAKRKSDHEILVAAARLKADKEAAAVAVNSAESKKFEKTNRIALWHGILDTLSSAEHNILKSFTLANRRQKAGPVSSEAHLKLVEKGMLTVLDDRIGLPEDQCVYEIPEDLWMEIWETRGDIRPNYFP